MLQDGTFRNMSLPKTMDGSGLDGVEEGLYLKRGSGFVNGAGLILGNDNPISKTLSNPVSTGILPHSLPEWAFRARPGLWQICLCPKVARIAEHKFGCR